MNNLKLKLGLVFSIVSVLLVTYLIGIYYNLDVGELPVEADIIIVNEGMYNERSEKAAELLNEGFADQILISPASPYVLQWYYNLGVQDEQIVRENEATSTWTNAVNSLEIIKENNWDTALVVTSDYHMRRVKFAYERVKESMNLDVRLTYVSAYPIEDGERIPYTQHPEHKRLALNEVYKLVGYLLGLYNVIDM